MRLLLSIIFSICLSTIVNSQQGIYPDSGVYVSLSNTFLNVFSSEFTTTVQNDINAFPIPNQSNKNGDISFDVSNIQHSVALADFYYSQASQDSYEIGWNSITFTINTDYQACYKIRSTDDLSVCEKGKVSISSQATLSLTSSITLNFDQSTPSISCTGTTLNVPSNGISYSVHCTSSVCDKTHDISNEIASQFVPAVQTQITTQINNNVGKYESLFPTLMKLNFNFNGNEFYLNSQGFLVESSVSSGISTPTAVLALNGGVIVQQTDGSFVYPSQSATGLPSSSVVESFPTDISVTLTPFLFESLVDAMFTSTLPKTILPSQVPSTSPVQLNTSDPFFNQTAPGLTGQYPDQSITLLIEQSSVSPIVSLNKTGVLISAGLNANFIVEGETVITVGFTFDVEITPALMQSGNGISVTGTLDKVVPYASVVLSTVGSVDTSGFIQLIQLAQGLVKIPTITIPNPLTTYSLADLSLVNNDQYVQILGNLESTTMLTSNSKINLN